MPLEMSFHLLQLRVIAHVQGRVRRGDVTERGLARLTGISQPHLHNILKGVRVLSPHMADLILRQLHINLLDLLEPDESSARHLPGDRQ
ncbi:MAG: transcriptional regulator, family [Bryobacterales bacterium]|nr:transcriptional regulator, family [Bryobacterales bacterium]